MKLALRERCDNLRPAGGVRVHCHGRARAGPAKIAALPLGLVGAASGCGVNAMCGDIFVTDDAYNDGLSDRDEGELGTTPTVEHSDGDGMTDGEERWGTGPARADTDFDHLDDDVELELGTDPLDPAPDHALDGDDVAAGTGPFTWDPP